MSDEEPASPPGVRVFIWACIALLALQAAAGWVLSGVLASWEQRGQFGDMFGVITAAFSALAFAGVIYAILLQRHDLALQRVELRLTRDELRRTAAAQEKSEVALGAQVHALLLGARISAMATLIDLEARRAEQLRQYGPLATRSKDLTQMETELKALLASADTASSR